MPCEAKKQTRPSVRESIRNSPFIQQNAGEAIAALVLFVLAFAALAIHVIINALR
ncbi:MAG: hypothetical protein IKK08_07540 [Clostridia bacterium]|nr:hypothetical protein [Clostridia bacterium]